MMAARKLTTSIFLFLGFLSLNSAAAQVVTFIDGQGDAVPRFTDLDADGPYDPQSQRLPDLLAIEISSFEPHMPHIDQFSGVVDENGGFIRIDVMLDGLINPTGELDYDNSESYEPAAYGPHPMVGYIEFDIDQNVNTGGDIEYPEFRYLANVARFGGLPTETRFEGRAARFEQEIDSNLNSEPHVERSGEEFHIALIDESPESIEIIVERPGGESSIFEDGETWWVTGDYFHRAHVYDEFTVSCGSGNDRYEPQLLMQYMHDEQSDVTTISLVIPKTNADAARLMSPTQSVQSNDGCDDNQYSIDEAVTDMIISATVADFFTRQLPEYQLLGDWESQSVSPALDISNWRVTAMLGTAYLPERVDGEEIIWSDVYPNVITGDVNGDTVVDEIDQAEIDGFIAMFDGTAFYDTDEDDQNDSISLFNYGPYYCVYDVNNDGLVDPFELVTEQLIGDFNLDGIVDGRDIQACVTALIDPAGYEIAYPNSNLPAIGDFNNDEVFNSDDLDGFLELLLGPQPVPLLGDLNGDDVVSIDDVDAFSLALTRPTVYQDTFGFNPLLRGDIDANGQLNGNDITDFLQLLLAP